jgi:MoaA/NifB/PqqE/SkfB family radical SAM enzyme
MNRKSRWYYYQRALKWKLLGDRSPIVAAIKVTQRCNLHCKHCTWSNKITKDLPLSEWKDIIGNLYEKGVTTIVIEGGEPTLYRGVKEIVGYIKSKNMFTIFITNGTRDISGINPDVFWISIDGMQESDNKIRGAGHFEKATKTIRNNRDKKIIILSTISKTNSDDVEAVCQYFSEVNPVFGLMFNFEYQYSDIEDVALNTEQRRAVAERIIALKKKYPKILSSRSYLQTVGKSKKCYPWLLVSVTANGKQRNDCMIRHVENYDCSKCDMSCYGELSKMYEMKRDTALFWSRNFGLPKLI